MPIIKSLLLVPILAMCALSQDIGAQSGASLTSSIKDAATAFAGQGASRTIAVLNFPGLDGRVSLLSTFIGEQLAVDLATALGSRGMVVERSQVMQVLQEERLLTIGLTARDAARIGKKLGANHVLVGTITVLGSQVIVNTRLVSTDNAAMAQAFRIEGSAPSEILRLDNLTAGSRPAVENTEPAMPKQAAAQVEACATNHTGNFEFKNSKPRAGALVRVYYQSSYQDWSDKHIKLSISPGEMQSIYDFPIGAHAYKITDFGEAVIFGEGQLMVEQCKAKSMTIR